VQHLSGTDAVEQPHAVPPGEPGVERGRERLAGAQAQPYAGERLRRDLGRQQRRVEGRYAEEQRRPVAGEDVDGTAGVGRAGSSTLRAPTENGNVKLLPSP
jgi:hypothetical protein